MPDYIPSSDGPALDWMQNFSALITAAPATYGLVAADATAIAAAVSAFDTALTAAIDPATRTKVTVITKNENRAAAEGRLPPVRRHHQAQRRRHRLRQDRHRRAPHQ